MATAIEENPLLIEASKVIPYKGHVDSFLDGHKGGLHTFEVDYAMGRQHFLKNEVELLWEAEQEKLVPSGEMEDLVFIGRWQKHPESDLYVRVSRTAIALAKDLQGFRDSPWFYVWHRDNFSRRFETQGGISLTELTKATGLVADFDQTLKDSMPVYS